MTKSGFSRRVAHRLLLFAGLGATAFLTSCALPQLSDHGSYSVPAGAQVDTLYSANSRTGALSGKYGYTGSYADDRAVQGAGIDSHPRVEAARWFAEGLRGEARGLAAERYPRLSMQAATGYAYTSGRSNSSSSSSGAGGGSCSTGSCGKTSCSRCGGGGSSAGSGGSMGSGWRARHEARLVFSQRVFDGRRSKYAEEAGMSAAMAAELSAGTVAQTIAIEYSTAQLDYLQARDITHLVRGLVDAHSRMLSITNDKLSSGLQSQADVDLVHSRLARSRSLLSSQDLLMSDASVRFRTISGKSPESVAGPPQPSSSQLTALRLSNNSEIKAAEETLRSRQLESEAARRLAYPNVDLEVGARAGDGFYGVASADEEVQALLVFSWDILDGGYRKAERYRTEAGIREAQELVRASKMDVRQLWELGREMRESASQRIGQLDARIASLSKAINALESDFASSKQPVLNVLDMQDELFESKAERVLERFNKLRGEYAMLAASGDLVRTLERSGVPNSDRRQTAQRQDAHLAVSGAAATTMRNRTSVASTAPATSPTPRAIYQAEASAPPVVQDSRPVAPTANRSAQQPATAASAHATALSELPVRRASTYQRRNPYANPMGGFSGF